MDGGYFRSPSGLLALWNYGIFTRVFRLHSAMVEMRDPSKRNSVQVWVQVTRELFTLLFLIRVPVPSSGIVPFRWNRENDDCSETCGSWWWMLLKTEGEMKFKFLMPRIMQSSFLLGDLCLLQTCSDGLRFGVFKSCKCPGVLFCAAGCRDCFHILVCRFIKMSKTWIMKIPLSFRASKSGQANSYFSHLREKWPRQTQTQVSITEGNMSEFWGV